MRDMRHMKDITGTHLKIEAPVAERPRVLPPIAGHKWQTQRLNTASGNVTCNGTGR
jgi:hypothetical protein